MGSFWEKLGLENNPYDPKPLGISKEDKKLFVGRDQELKQLKVITSGSSGGISIVEGEIGVGKTSFVNIFQYDKLDKDKFLPSYENIEITGTDPTSFMLSVLSNMISNLEQVVESKLLTKYDEYKNAKMFVDTTIQSGWGINFQVFGTGGGVSKNKTVTQPPAVVLQTIKKTIDKWVTFVIDKIGYTSIIIPLDNFDIVSEENIISFLNSMRDTLISRDNIWWIIIGQKGLTAIIEKNIPRVSAMISGQSIKLDAMNVDEVNSMIDLRYKNLKISSKGKVKLIVPKEVIKILYDVSKGDTRYILKKATDMIFAFIGEYPSQKEISEKVAKKMLYDESKIRIEDGKLTPRQLEILEKISKIGTFQPKDFKKLRLKSSQAVNKYVKKFLPLGYLLKIQTAGKDVYYRTTGDVNIYFDKVFTNQ